MIRLLAALACLLAWPAQAITILARCGPSKGQSYYFEGGLVGPGRSGWMEDGFDRGRIILYIGDGDAIDIAFRDDTGARSYRKEGNKVDLVNFDEENRSILVSVSGQTFVETYLFRLNKAGLGTVMWTSNKNDKRFTKTSWFSAECGPRFQLDQ